MIASVNIWVGGRGHRMKEDCMHVLFTCWVTNGSFVGVLCRCGQVLWGGAEAGEDGFAD